MAKTLKNKPKVLVGMSGGVDSSVAAALLQKQGYDVVGVFLHFWKESGVEGTFENKCCSLESQEEARKVTQKLGIPFYTVNVSREFKKEVVDYFIREYKAGKTPNPCIVCNREIKFKVLFQKMMELKGDFIATGHYAKIKDGVLREAKDKEKDQSYFLYALSKKQLERTLFPLGEFTKPKIRELARKYGFSAASKKDSQDICFISDSTNEFLNRQIKMKPGKIVNESGKELGCHQGLPLYTFGQRKGIKIGGDGPYFVVGKNAERNELVVSNSTNESKEMELGKVNWILKPEKLPAKVLIRTRYRNPLMYAKIELNKSKNKKVPSQKEIYKVTFDKSQKAVTPGQSAVMYGKRGEVIGGGIIS